MQIFEIISLLTTLAAAFAWLNYRYLRMPQTIGLMAIALCLSLALVVLGQFVPGADEYLERGVRAVDFDAALLHGMLGALLFAGALHVNLDDLIAQRGVISVLATFGVVLSTVCVGGMMWVISNWLGLEIPVPYCLAFGALVSPTDPVAVIGILKQVRVPRTLEMKIAGESLFNDGIGVVLFVAILQWVRSGKALTVNEVAHLFVVDALGGALFGLILGFTVYRLLLSVDQYQVEILLTLAIVTGGYFAAEALTVSGPLAMVVAGIFIGNRGRRLGMSDRTRKRLDDFWELVDEFLNAVLFVLIGLEVIVMQWTGAALLLGFLAIPLVLFSRWISVGIPIRVLRRRRSISPHAIKVLTWVGLRGGISVALALSLPAGESRDLLLAVTYVVVCFSVLVQGLSLAPLLRHLYPAQSAGQPYP